MGDDIVAATGPDWLDGPGLQFNSVFDISYVNITLKVA